MGMKGGLQFLWPLCSMGFALCQRDFDYPACRTATEYIHPVDTSSVVSLATTPTNLPLPQLTGNWKKHIIGLVELATPTHLYAPAQASPSEFIS